MTTSVTAFSWALLVLRVVVGLTMAAHGYQKYFLGGRIPGTAGWFESLGMKPGRFHALVAATTEITSGILMALGLITPVAAAAFVGIMTVAAWIHRDHGFYVFKEGIEYNIVLAVVAVVIATIGPGEYSLDHALGWFGDPWEPAVGFAISAGLGLVASIGQLAVFYRPERTPPA